MHRSLEPADVLFFQKDDFSEVAGGSSATQQDVDLEIAELSWDPWCGERLVILFRRTAGGNSDNTEVALYNVNQDGRFGTPPRMAFTLLGKVAAVNSGRPNSGGSMLPTLAVFSGAPGAVQPADVGSGRLTYPTSARFDALLGVMWASSNTDGSGTTGVVQGSEKCTASDDRASGTTRAIVSYIPLVYRQGPAPSAAANMARAHAWAR